MCSKCNVFLSKVHYDSKLRSDALRKRFCIVLGPSGVQKGAKMGPNSSPKWCRQAVPEADLVFDHFPSDFCQKTLKILIIARSSKKRQIGSG